MLRPSARSIAFSSFLLLTAVYAQASAQVRPPVRVPVGRPPAPVPTTRPSAPPSDSPATKPGVKAGEAVVTTQARLWTLPTVSYGPIQLRPTAVNGLGGIRGVAEEDGNEDVKATPRSLTTEVKGQMVTAKVLQLRGLDDIEKSELPEGAKRLLLMHMGTIAADQSAQYIVNPELAREWMSSHPPVPPNIRPPEKKSGSQGCSTRHMSMRCVKNEGQQAIDKASEEWERLREQAQVAWNNASGELTNTWQMAQGCFADHTLSLKDIPVKFSVAPGHTFPIAGWKSKSKGDASGELSGSVSIGFPMESDFSAKLDLFYIPCLPFAIRPKALGANGSMTVGEQLTASVVATGEFESELAIPPAGGPTIPIAMLPIVVAGVPIAELDISAFVEGSVTLAGKGKAEGKVQVENKHRVDFEFACNGGGCGSNSHTAREPVSLTESAQLQGRVTVEPAIFTAIQLNFNFNMLSVRAGPEPFLLAALSGCAAVGAQQTEGGGSSTSHNEALMADLDWGVRFRAEALIAGKIVGNAFEKSLTGNRHIWFRDLIGGGSSALVAMVDTAPQATAGKPARYTVRMPSCYMDTTPVRYRITWTGGATAAPTDGCDWARSICTFDPKTDLVIDLTWPAEGNYTLDIAPVGDEHGGGGLSKSLGGGAQLRTFDPAPKPTVVPVTVGPAS